MFKSRFTWGFRYLCIYSSSTFYSFFEGRPWKVAESNFTLSLIAFFKIFLFLYSSETRFCVSELLTRNNSKGFKFERESWNIPIYGFILWIQFFSNYTFICITGEHNLRKADGTEQVIPIDKIFIHPNYNPPATGPDYDVALIKLKEPIRFNNDVRPVCLPTRDFPPGTNCYVTGWGATREGGNIAQVNMTYVHDVHDKRVWIEIHKWAGRKVHSRRKVWRE